jgi:hypothetical protein
VLVVNTIFFIGKNRYEHQEQLDHGAGQSVPELAGVAFFPANGEQEGVCTPLSATRCIGQIMH